MTRPSFSTQFHTLADELFVNSPASGEGCCRYVQSHGFHGRRFLALDNEHPPSERYAEFDLSAHVREADRLGPYERQVLAEIVHAPHRLVMIVGYAGAGKSSTLRHVLEHYAHHRVPRTVEPGRGALFRQIRAQRPLYAYVDFEPIWMRVASNGPDDAAARAALLRHWAEALPSAINRMLSNRQLLRDCVATALRWAVEAPSEFPDYPVPAALTAFYMKFPGKVSDAQDADDVYHRVLTTLGELAIEHRIEFWHAILDIIKLHSYSKDIVVVVYDNADPMDAPLQRAMHEILNCIATTCRHKIVAPVRPVTFQVRGFSAACNWYPHSGPSPIDILSQRLLSFLHHPEQLVSYRDMPQEQAQRALGRALDVLARLQRNYGHRRSLGRVLSWMAGDSARRVLEMVRSIFLSDQLLEIDSSQAATVRAVRGRYELRAVLDRLVISLGEEIVAVAGDVVIALGGGNDIDPDDLAARLAGTVDLVLASSLRVPASELLGIALPDLQQVLREEAPAARRSIQGSCEAAMIEIALREASEPRRRAVLERVCRGYRARLPALVERHTWRHPDVAPALIGFLESLAEPAPHDPHDNLEIEPSAANERAVEPWAHLNKPFLSVQLALRHGTSRSNAFMIDDELSLSKLHILWFLAGVRNGSATVQELVTTLRALEHDDAHILQAVNELVNQHVRLMWLDRCFRYPTIDALLLEPNHRVVLSRAGWGYQSALTSEIDYLLVNLSAANVNLTSQLQNVMLSLRALHELEALLRARPDRPRTAPASMFSAVRDIIVRAAAQFHDLAARHFRKLSRNTDRDELRHVVVSYERLLADVEDVPPIASTLRVGVLRSIDPHQVALIRVDARREREAIRSALAGSRFWTDGMTPDELHLAS